MNKILNDFRETNFISYEEYSKLKSFPLLEISNIPKGSRKINNRLVLNNIEYNLEDLSINDVINLFLGVPGVRVSIYKENSLNFLSYSALFLKDFSSDRVEVFNITKTSTKISELDTFKDYYNNSYKAVKYKVYDNYGNPLNFRIEDGYIQANFTGYGKIYVTYSTTALKIRALEEYPITELNQIEITREGF